MPVGAALVALVAAASAMAEIQPPKVHVGVGGRSELFHLQLTVTEILGYFKEQGLSVTISDFQGGSKPMQVLVGRSGDEVAGAYEHTVTTRPNGRTIHACVEMGRYHGYASGGATSKAASAKSYKGLTPCSSTRVKALLAASAL